MARMRLIRRAFRFGFSSKCGLFPAAIVAGLSLAGPCCLAADQPAAAAATQPAKADIAAIRQDLVAATAARPLPLGQFAPSRLAAKFIDQANILLQQDDPMDKALTDIALRRTAEADKLIADLQAKPGNSQDRIVRLLLMEGDNWYRAADSTKPWFRTKRRWPFAPMISQFAMM